MEQQHLPRAWKSGTDQLNSTSAVLPSFCEYVNDSILHWPTTGVDQEARIACPLWMEESEDHVTIPRFATRMCHSNGSWHAFANYSDCISHEEDHLSIILRSSLEIEMLKDKMDSIISFGNVYLVGYSLSIIAMTAALTVFMTFRRLRCMRNYIHSQLLLALLLKSVLWITIFLTEYSGSKMDEPACRLVMSLFIYFNLSQFVWMFLEGLNMIIILVWTMSVDAISLRQWLSIGWGLPIPIVLAWIIFNSLAPDYNPQSCWTVKASGPEAGADYIVMVPMLLLLTANFIFMSFIIWILLTKLRSLSTQLRQAGKATVVLIPLLGMNYLIWLFPPEETDTLSAYIYVYGHALLQSTQGLIVALIYCFSNGEVKSTLRKKLQHWKDSWTLPTSG